MRGLDRALVVAELVEKGRAAQSASANANPEGQQMRRVRDRTVARVHTLQGEIRKYGKHAFRKDPKISAAFASDYMRRKRSASGEQDKTTPSAVREIPSRRRGVIDSVRAEANQEATRAIPSQVSIDVLNANRVQF